MFVTILLAFSNFFVRLPFVPTLDAIPIIFWTMLPLMALFAIPIAASLAVQMPLGSLMVNHETLFFYFLSSARRAPFKAAAIFSLSLLLLYVPLVFEWSPRCYSEGKRQLISLAKKQFSRFAPKVFNEPFPGCTVFFKEKIQPSDQTSLYKSLLLAFRNKSKGYYVFTANTAYLHQDSLFLEKGALYTQERKDHYHATFDRAEIQISKLLDEGQKDSGKKKLKFLKWKELLEGLDNDNIFNEFHKRIAQIIWLLFLPFLALLSMFVFGREGKSNLVPSLALSGFFFMSMYLCTMVGQIFSKNLFIALCCFYLPPPLFLGGVFYLYRKRV